MVTAIVFVKAVGFGALAGIASLTVASVGFIGKLFAEAIEEISLKALPFAAGSIIALFIIAYFPQISLWLPRVLGY